MIMVECINYRSITGKKSTKFVTYRPLAVYLKTRCFFEWLAERSRKFAFWLFLQFAGSSGQIFYQRKYFVAIFE